MRENHGKRSTRTAVVTPPCHHRQVHRCVNRSPARTLTDPCAAGGLRPDTSKHGDRIAVRNADLRSTGPASGRSPGDDSRGRQGQGRFLASDSSVHRGSPIRPGVIGRQRSRTPIDFAGGAISPPRLRALGRPESSKRTAPASVPHVHRNRTSETANRHKTATGERDGRRRHYCLAQPKARQTSRSPDSVGCPGLHRAFRKAGSR